MLSQIINEGEAQYSFLLFQKTTEIGVTVPSSTCNLKYCAILIQPDQQGGLFSNIFKMEYALQKKGKREEPMFCNGGAVQEHGKSKR